MSGLSGVEIFAVGFAGVAALAATTQTYFVAKAIDSSFAISIHERRVSNCIDIISALPKYRGSFYHYMNEWDEYAKAIERGEKTEIKILEETETDFKANRKFASLIDDFNVKMDLMLALWGVRSVGAYGLGETDFFEEYFGPRKIVAEAFKNTTSLWLHSVDVSPYEGISASPTARKDRFFSSLDRLEDLCRETVSGEKGWLN